MARAKEYGVNVSYSKGDTGEQKHHVKYMGRHSDNHPWHEKHGRLHHQPHSRSMMRATERRRGGTEKPWEMWGEAEGHNGKFAVPL